MVDRNWLVNFEFCLHQKKKTKGLNFDVGFNGRERPKFSEQNWTVKFRIEATGS